MIDPWPARAMRGLLDQDPAAVSPGDPLPLGWHWLYFRDPLPASSLGPDGHEARGAFMPPGDLPRRMWAGGSLRALRPVIVGKPAELRSRVASVVEKVGRSGRLAFVAVQHEVRQGGRRCVEEEQVIVYREAGPQAQAETRADAAGRPSEPVPPGEGRSEPVLSSEGRSEPVPSSEERSEPVPSSKAPPEAAPERVAPVWVETFLPTEIALFRFSALTYNAHRIHYDRPYAEAEGYPALLVHAPLTVLVLLDAAERWWGAAGSFEYRATAPLFANQPVQLVGRETPAGSPGSPRIAEALGADGVERIVGRFSHPNVPG